MALADDIATYLATQGVGVIAGTTSTSTGLPTIFIGQYPPSPDRLIAIRETGGVEPNYAHGTADPYQERPRVQVTVRDVASGGGYDASRATILSINVTLRRVTNTRISSSSGVLYHAIRPAQEPLYLGTEEGTERQLWVQNFEITKDKSI